MDSASLINNENISWAESQDVTGLRSFLMSAPERPLICIGSGGSITACEYTSLLHNATVGVARTITPYSAYSLGIQALHKAKILLISHSGHNNDIVYIARHCAAINPEFTANITTKDSERNYVKKYIRPENSFNFRSEISDRFISVNSTEATLALLCKAYKPTSVIARSHSTQTIDINLLTAPHFIILHGSWGQPVAIDIESKLVESGLATTAVSDYRNFCHGRFMFPINHSGHEKRKDVPDDCAIVMLVTPRENTIAEKIRDFLPKNVRIMTLQTDIDGAEATIDLLIQGWNLVRLIGKARGIDPQSPPNHGSIDKRRPQQIPFLKDIKKAGPLVL